MRPWAQNELIGFFSRKASLDKNKGFHVLTVMLVKNQI